MENEILNASQLVAWVKRIESRIPGGGYRDLEIVILEVAIQLAALRELLETHLGGVGGLDRSAPMGHDSTPGSPDCCVCGGPIAHRAYQCLGGGRRVHFDCMDQLRERVAADYGLPAEQG